MAGDPNPDRRFFREAFSNVTAGQFGDSARKAWRAPSASNVDFSTIEDFKIREARTIQFGMDMFNAPNHPAWGRPNAGWDSHGAYLNAAFGRIRSTSQLRQIQSELKCSFRNRRRSGLASQRRRASPATRK